MFIDNYDLFQKRLKTSATIPLEKLEEDKMKTFEIALERSYNREIVERKDGSQIKCLISGINTQPKIEKKSFSTLVKNNCDVGEVLYWPRRNSYWIITDMEETEKNIFQGYISQALYHLKWLDPETGIVYDEWACTKGPEETTISDGVKHNIKYDNLNQSLYLMMPKNSKGMELLDRYFELFVNGRKWKVQVADRYSYDKLVILQLVESLINEDTDDTENEIVDGKIDINYLFSCSLDGIDSLKRGQEFALLFSLYKNEELSTLSPQILTENCYYENNKLIFNSAGEASITFNYPDINKTYEYFITVTEDEIVNELLSIVGDSIVRTMTYNIFAFEYILNGEKIEVQGQWSFDEDYFNVISEDNKEIKLKVKNKVGSTSLAYYFEKDNEIKTVTFDIKIKSIYERG